MILHNSRRAVLLFASVAVAILGGCASPAKLSLQSRATANTFAQRFSQAYVDRSDSGDYDIVLVEDGSTSAQEKAGAPLMPIATAPLRQIVHVRVFWKPVRGQATADPEVTNAAMHWYFLSSSPDAARDLLLYNGAGFVSVHPKGSSVRVEIRSGRMTPAIQRGTLGDPLGPSDLRGSFTAQINRGRVRALLTELRAATTPSDPNNAAASSPPPRGTTGP